MKDHARRLAFERWNTCLPADAPSFQHLDDVPRLSTLAIGYLIQAAVAAMPQDLQYVNVGVWRGFTLFTGMTANPHKRCVGVESFAEPLNSVELLRREFASFASPAHVLHEQDYEDYFAQTHAGPIGVYYYDGDHSYEHQLHGLVVAEPFFVKGSLIFVDDTNWDEPRRATDDFVAQSEHSYERVLDIRTATPGHPTYWNGLIVLRKN
jgi:hypothetical protein